VQCCIPVGQLPNAITLDPTGRYLCVIKQLDSTVSIIDSVTNVVVKTVPAGAPNLAVWGSSGSFLNHRAVTRRRTLE